MHCLKWQQILVTEHCVRLYITDAKVKAAPQWATIDAAREPQSAYQSLLRVLAAMCTEWNRATHAAHVKAWREVIGDAVDHMSKAAVRLMPLHEGYVHCGCSAAPAQHADLSFVWRQGDYKAFLGKVKAWATAVGLQDAQAEALFGTHFFRIGGRSEAAACGMPDAVAQRQGRWCSPHMSRHYVTQWGELAETVNALRKFNAKTAGRAPPLPPPSAPPGEVCGRAPARR